jgi:hypothetical protein
MPRWQSPNVKAPGRDITFLPFANASDPTAPQVCAAAITATINLSGLIPDQSKLP